MNQLNHLRESTDKVLYGLVADRNLKNRIENEMQQREAGGRRSFFSQKLLPSLAAVSAALILGLVVLGSLRTEANLNQPQLTSVSAGAQKSAAFQRIPSGEDPAVQVGQDLYFMLSERPEGLEVRELLGAVDGERILSASYPSGTEVFLTSQDRIIAVRAEGQFFFLARK